MLDLCNSDHDIIVHDRRDCPLCEAMKTIQDLEDANKELLGQKEDLESQVENLEEELKGKEN